MGWKSAFGNRGILTDLPQKLNRSQALKAFYITRFELKNPVTGSIVVVFDRVKS